MRALARSSGDSPGAALPPRDALTALLLQHTALSRREADVAALVCVGSADKDIARTLGMGFTTVRTHLAAAFRKLGCDNRTQLARRLVQLLLH